MIGQLLIVAVIGMGAAAALRRLPLVEQARIFSQTSHRAIRALGRSGASDHWKERMLRGCALRTLRATAITVGLLGAFVLAISSIVFVLDGLFDLAVFDVLLAPSGLIAATFGGFLWLALAKVVPRKQNSDYGLLERIMHRLVLGNRGIAEACFDMDQRIVRGSTMRVEEGAHVFVVGLARAGTTALMRTIHDSGAFRSLLYEDMPFVLAPNLWQKLRRPRRDAEAMQERAHGDGLMVSQKSPECLDEVFWRVFDGEAYIGQKEMLPHHPSAELQKKFRAYVAAILNTTPEKRYISKNNNNIIRLPAIHAMFPNAHILVMFRDPLDHATSLLRQHRRFTERQTDDPFVGAYMNWLAHHEFGAGHLPFAPEAAEGSSPNELLYWLRQWSAVYERLLKEAPNNATFICYEGLCDDPALWPVIAEKLDIPEGAPDLKKPHHKPIPLAGSDDALVYARDVYDRLVARSEAQWGATPAE